MTPEPEAVTPEPAVEAAPVDSSPVEYVLMQDGDLLLLASEKTSGRVVVRVPEDQSAISLPQEAAGTLTPLTPETLKYRSESQKSAIAKVLSELGKTEEDVVEAVAQGIIPVSKDGTIKQIKRPNLLKLLKRLTLRIWNLTYPQKRAERVLTKIDNDLGGEFAKTGTAISRSCKEDYCKRRPATRRPNLQ